MPLAPERRLPHVGMEGRHLLRCRPNMLALNCNSTKMAVVESARGLKAGEYLLEHTVARARELGAKKLYLLTNAKCAAAIHLYEKLGFVHDPTIMVEYGARYERCDVAMRYAGW